MHRWWTVGTALSIAALGVGLLTDAGAVAEGVRRGLAISGNVLIPALFPFMVLAVFLSLSRYAEILSVPLRPVTTRIFKLPGQLGIVVLLSLVGGYPVGAKMIAGLLEQGKIDRATAERMLCFCVNSGPSFMIAAVGIGMFFDRTAGVILFGVQTTATLLIGWMISLRVPQENTRLMQMRGASGASALVMAVQSATSSMLVMCGFAVLFSGLQAMLLSGGIAAWLCERLPGGEAVIRAAVCGLLEVTTGCAAAAEVGGRLGFALACVMVSFGGLSVLFQIFSCFGEKPVRFRPLVLSRVVHAGLSTLLALPLYDRFCAYTATASMATPQLQTDTGTALVSVCLLGMCAIFCLSIREDIQPNELNLVRQRWRRKKPKKEDGSCW